MEEIKLSNVESLSGLVNMIGLATLYNSQKGQNALIEISKKEIVVSYVRDNCVAIHKSPYTINDVFGVELSKYIGDKTLIFKKQNKVFFYQKSLKNEENFKEEDTTYLTICCTEVTQGDDVILLVDDEHRE